MHTKSNNHPSQKIGILKTLVTRAVRIYDTEHLKEELSHLSRVLQENGYEKKHIKKDFLKTQKPMVKNSKGGWCICNFGMYSLVYFIYCISLYPGVPIGTIINVNKSCKVIEVNPLSRGKKSPL